jgi:hypothetical protein
MRSTGSQGCDIYVARAYTEVRPGLERSKESEAQWPHRACAKHGLRSVMLRANLSGLLLSCSAQKAGDFQSIANPTRRIRLARGSHAPVNAYPFGPLAETNIMSASPSNQTTLDQFPTWTRGGSRCDSPRNQSVKYRLKRAGQIEWEPIETQNQLVLEWPALAGRRIAAVFDQSVCRAMATDYGYHIHHMPLRAIALTV